MYRDWYIQINTAQVEEYGVKQAPFDVALRSCPTVVKMDIEGSEIPILLQKWDWKLTRLLMVEISVVHLRQEYGPSSWRIFADILENLGEAGFALAKIEKRFWTLEYWTPGTTQRSLLSDGILWFVRPDEKKGAVLSKVNNSEIEDYTSWRHYRQVMEAGGLKGNMNAAQAAQAFKVTWIQKIHLGQVRRSLQKFPLE